MADRSTAEVARLPAANVLDAIGDTPLVELDRYLERSDIRVWAKLECLNPGGSAKARPAARMLSDAIARGEVGHGTTIVESTSGNMGVGLAQVCRFHGMRLICVVDSRTTKLNLQTMRALGAEIRMITEPDYVGGDLLEARLNEVARLVETVPGSFWPNQYSNRSNPAAHSDGTAREIDEVLDGRVDHLLVAVSTAGTLAGCASYIGEAGRPTNLIAVDAVGSALFGGSPAPRRLPGYGAGVETPMSRGLDPDRIVRVSDIDAVVACRRLVDREAILAGASSGAVAAALSALAPEFEPGSRIAMIFHDGGTGYLDSVYDDDWVLDELGYSREDVATMTGARDPR